MSDLINNYGLYICIGLGVLVVIVAIILIVGSKKNKKEELKVEEDNSSILDVNIDGVVDKDFNYGYGKTNTVVMKKEELVPEEKKEEDKKEDKKED